MNNTVAPLILVMGISGSGKSTIGKMLAERLDGTFLDADDFHATENIEKMSLGKPLNDEDRWPWLDRLALAVRDHQGPSPLVLACSALKASYRERLCLGNASVVFLTGPRDTIENRVSSRLGHYMPSQLLDSQLKDLEEPEDAITVSITNTPGGITDQIVRALGK